MLGIIRQIEDRRAKALAKVERAERLLESARAEVADTEAALRVVGALGDDDTTPHTTSPTQAVAERQANILHILPSNEAAAKEPKELHALYSTVMNDTVNLDTFRTTVWRMKTVEDFPHDGGRWRVLSDNGKYWRERTDDPNEL